MLHGTQNDRRMDGFHGTGVEGGPGIQEKTVRYSSQQATRTATATEITGGPKRAKAGKSRSFHSAARNTTATAIRPSSMPRLKERSGTTGDCRPDSIAA